MSAAHQSILGYGAGPPPTPLGTFTFASSEGATSIAWPASHQVDDLGILLVETCSQPFSTPAGWNLFNSPAGLGGGGNDSTKLYAFWRRATSSSEAAVTISDSGLVQLATMNVIRDADLSSSPIEAILDGDAGGGVSSTVASTTTLGQNRYVIGAVAVGGSASVASTNQSSCSWTANSNLTNFVELADSAFRGSTAGIGGIIGVFGGTRQSAGAVGATVVGTTGGVNVAYTVFAVKPKF